MLEKLDNFSHYKLARVYNKKQNSYIWKKKI